MGQFLPFLIGQSYNLAVLIPLLRPCNEKLVINETCNYVFVHYDELLFIA